MDADVKSLSKAMAAHAGKTKALFLHAKGPHAEGAKAAAKLHKAFSASHKKMDADVKSLSKAMAAHAGKTKALFLHAKGAHAEGAKAAAKLRKAFTASHKIAVRSLSKTVAQHTAKELMGLRRGGMPGLRMKRAVRKQAMRQAPQKCAFDHDTLEAMFSTANGQTSGGIGFKELAQVRSTFGINLSDRQMEESIRKGDRNADKHLNFKEFSSLLCPKDRGVKPPLAALAKTVRRFSNNNEGAKALERLHAIRRRLGHAVGGMPKEARQRAMRNKASVESKLEKAVQRLRAEGGEKRGGKRTVAKARGGARKINRLQTTMAMLNRKLKMLKAKARMGK